MTYKDKEKKLLKYNEMKNDGYWKEYYKNNKDKYKIYEMKRKDKINEYKKLKYKEDKVYNFKCRVREIAKRKIPLKNKVCSICNSKEKLHRHHEDYNKPLDVKILCRRCHRNIHSQLSYPRGNDWGVSNVF